MTDQTDLAALLRECYDAHAVDGSGERWDVFYAARLHAAGVRVGEGCPSCGAPRSGCNDCGWKPEQPIVALAPIKQVELFETSIVKDPPHPSWTIQRVGIDPDRLARAVKKAGGCRLVVCKPHAEVAAAIVKAYEEEG